MKALLLLPLLFTLFPPGQDPAAADENAQVVVVSFKYFKDRQQIANARPATFELAPAMIPQNKNFERQRRENASAGDRDPNLDTLDGRGAALEKIVQDSREAPPVAGFAYQIKIQNTGAKLIQKIFWEYQFKETANPTNVTHRQFLCVAKIKPEKDRDLQAFSLSGPSDVISAKSLAKSSANQFEERVVLNRVEYADGSFWQRKGWKFDFARLIPKKDREPGLLPVCRSL